MGENTDNEEGGASINRRRLMKVVGAGAVAAPASVGAASASSEDGRAPEYEELEKWRARFLAYGLFRTEEYRQLVEIVEDHGATVANLDRAGRIRANGTTRELVSFRLRSTSHDDGYLTIGRDRGEGVSVATVEFNTYADDGILQEHVVYDVLESGRGAETFTTAAGDVEAAVRTVEPEDEIREAIEGAKRRIENGEDFTTNDACYECKWAAVLICENFCGAAGGFACGVLGITAIGGVSCLTLVTVVCALKSAYACGQSGIGEAACAEVGLC